MLWSLDPDRNESLKVHFLSRLFVYGTETFPDSSLRFRLFLDLLALCSCLRAIYIPRVDGTGPLVDRPRLPSVCSAWPGVAGPARAHLGAGQWQSLGSSDLASPSRSQ